MRKSKIITFMSLFFTMHIAIAEEVRKSTSNLCHTSDSGSFNQIKIDEKESNVFTSMESCIESGGRPTKKYLEKLAAEDPAAAEEATTKIEENEKIEKIEATYAGFNWGAGLMFAHTDTSVIKDVSIENGKVSVNNQTNSRAIAMLESHYFFVPGKKKIFGHGPFVAVGLGGENTDPLSTYGVGYMVGFRKQAETSSWNVGFGYFVDSNAKQLKGQIKDGDDTTETDPNKLLTTSDIGGLMLMFSSSF